MKYLAHHQFWRILTLLALDGLYFGITDPLRVPSFMIIISFSLLTASVYLLVVLLLRLGSFYGLPLSRHSKQLAGVASGLLTALLALQSIGQLGPRDVLVVLPLCVMTYLYVFYGRTVNAE